MFWSSTALPVRCVCPQIRQSGVQGGPIPHISLDLVYHRHYTNLIRLNGDSDDNWTDTETDVLEMLMHALLSCVYRHILLLLKNDFVLATFLVIDQTKEFAHYHLSNVTRVNAEGCPIYKKRSVREIYGS